MLQCTKCLIYKPDEDFPRNRRAVSRRGRFHNCRACAHEHYEANKARHKRQCRANSIKRRYGLTLEEYDTLVAQGCSICGETEKRIVLDHCHATEAVRAPLCDACNIMLGGARDRPDLLRAAAEYLERHSAV
jgi:hypothetical protein